MSSLSQRAGRALGLNLANTLATRIGTFAIGVALARIVGPEEFGTFAVALLALLAVLAFNELGVSLAIVRWPGRPEAIAPTVATISLVSSFVIFLLALALAPVFCDAMGTPEATNVVRLLSINVLISGIVAAPAGMLQRDFRAGRRMLIDQVGTWSSAIVSISCALADMGAMSLAVGRLTGAALSLVLFLHAAPVRLGFDREIARRLLAFGLPLAGSSIVVFAVTFVDQIVVGAVLGPVALGLYVLAFNLSSWPVNVFSQPVRQVAPATFARLQHDPPAMRRAFVLSAGLLTAIVVPVCLVLSGAAVPLIDVVYGSDWAPAADVLVWLGVFAAFRILFELAYDYFVVVGSTGVILGVQVVWLVALVPAVWAGAEQWGIAGAGAAQAAVAVGVILPVYLVQLRGVGVPSVALAGSMAVPTLAGLAVGAVAYGAHELIDVSFVDLAVAGVAMLVALALQRNGIRDALDHMRSVLAEGDEAETSLVSEPVAAATSTIAVPAGVVAAPPNPTPVS